MTALNLALHKRQTEAFQSIATEILYGGAAGGGKSHLMRVIAIIFCAEIAGLQVYLFRRHFADLYKNHMEGAGSFIELMGPWIDAGLVKINYSDNVIRFWNGSKIHLCHCQHEKDVHKYLGTEIHLLLMDELTLFSEKMYRYLRARCRLGGLVVPEKYKGKLPMVLAGTNPGNIGHNWVKRVWVDSAPPMHVHRAAKTEGGMLRQFVPALLQDNPTLAINDPDYIDRLEGLGRPELVKAMKSGDWNIVAGGAFDDVWSQRLILPRFKVPAGWTVDRSFDWGSTHPFSVGWWAEADGTEVNLEGGRVFCPPRGSLIRIHEWYGTKEIGTNEGLKLAAKDIAKGILEREKGLRDGGWIARTPMPGPADNQIGDRGRPDVETIAEEMAKAGVKWTASDKTPGSRIGGLELARGMMREAGKDRPETRGLWFMEHCRAAISIVPILPRDEKKPDDVDTDAEDHPWDETRYRCLAKKRTFSTEPLRM